MYLNQLCDHVDGLSNTLISRGISQTFTLHFCSVTFGSSEETSTVWGWTGTAVTAEYLEYQEYQEYQGGPGPKQAESNFQWCPGRVMPNTCRERREEPPPSHDTSHTARLQRAGGGVSGGGGVGGGRPTHFQTWHMDQKSAADSSSLFLFYSELCCFKSWCKSVSGSDDATVSVQLLHCLKRLMSIYGSRWPQLKNIGFILVSQTLWVAVLELIIKREKVSVRIF